jgi:hypothetical protein
MKDSAYRVALRPARPRPARQFQITQPACAWGIPQPG